MLYNFSLTIFFRFVNFAAFAALAVYLYKRYLSPSLQKQIHEKKVLLQNLETQKQGIKYQLNNLDQAIEQQNFLAQELTQKIEIWSTFVQAHNEKNRREMKANQSEIDRRTAIKNENILFERTNKKIIPKLLTTLKHDLAKEFEKPDEALKYSNDILSFIEKSSE